MTLRELRYLVALADHRHFGRAAEACHVTQPTLSAQLRKLEDYLGHSLIDRQARQFTLTPLGEQVVERARRLLTEADDILELTRHRTTPLSGALSLGIIPTLAPYYLPELLRTLATPFPKLRLIVQEDLTTALGEKLDAQLLDAALLALPTPFAPERHDERPLFDEPFWAALPAAAEEAQGPSEAALEVDALDRLPLLLLTDGHCLRGQALAVCAHRDRETDDGADCRASSLETLRQLVSAGLGYTLLPQLATRDLDPQRVVIRPLAGAPFRRIGLVWRQGHPRARELRLLAETLAAHPPGGLSLSA